METFPEPNVESCPVLLHAAAAAAVFALGKGKALL